MKYRLIRSSQSARLRSNTKNQNAKSRDSQNLDSDVKNPHLFLDPNPTNSSFASFPGLCLTALTCRMRQLNLQTAALYSVACTDG